MVQRYLGIDIGSYNIKIADIVIDKKSITISEPVVAKTPRFLVQNGRIAEKDEFISIKRRFTKRKV
ncbi:MAG: pilus assembly protein PilM [Clostridia bacterium]|nr:pilus assembly protein PilM [Clostridia bacterium]